MTRTLGFTCFNYGTCGNTLDTPHTKSGPAEGYAGVRGWCIGHLDGQGQIACPDCSPMIWDPMPLCDWQARARATAN